jgi:hypothetical protein
MVIGTLITKTAIVISAELFGKWVGPDCGAVEASRSLHPGRVAVRNNGAKGGLKLLIATYG